MIDAEKNLEANIAATLRFRGNRSEFQRALTFSVRKGGKRQHGEREGETVRRPDALAEILKTHGGCPCVEATGGIVIIRLDAADADALAAHSPAVPIIAAPGGEAGFAVFRRGGVAFRLARGEAVDFAAMPGAVIAAEPFTTWPGAADLAAADAAGAIPAFEPEVVRWLTHASADLLPLALPPDRPAAPAPRGRCGSCRHHAGGRCRVAAPERRIGEDGASDRAAFPAMPSTGRCAKWAAGKHAGNVCAGCSFFVAPAFGLGRCEAHPVAPVDRFGRKTGNTAEYLKISPDEPACAAFIKVIDGAAA